MLNKHAWNWFYSNVKAEAKRFYGVNVSFIYRGVIITDVCNNKRAEFYGDDFVRLFDSVQMYLTHNYKRRVAVIHIKGGRHEQRRTIK